MLFAKARMQIGDNVSSLSKIIFLILMLINIIKFPPICTKTFYA